MSYSYLVSWIAVPISCDVSLRGRDGKARSQVEVEHESSTEFKLQQHVTVQNVLKAEILSYK